MRSWQTGQPEPKNYKSKNGALGSDDDCKSEKIAARPVDKDQLQVRLSTIKSPMFWVVASIVKNQWS